MASPKKKWLRMKAAEDAASKAQAVKVAEAQRAEATAAVKASVEKVTQTRRPRRSKNIEN
tara:strand:- start:62 stop:241 length:180 start_codon:yes stop_codon:yes gene_type:complete